MFWHYLSIVALSSIKFMFAPIYGKVAGLNFAETYISLMVGGLITSLVFYKFTYRLLNRAARKRQERRKNALDMGFEYFEPKKFTRTNKLIVNTRRRFGFFVCTFFFPFFLSVPVGTIIATKFYGKKPLFYPLVAAGLAFNGFIGTAIIYLL